MGEVTWQPEDWQRHVDCLCRLRHGPTNYVRVPDEHGGDLGLDGFSLDGCAYQAYVPEEPVVVKVRYEKQRDKITADIRKFSVVNGDEIKKLLGTTVISRWILVTPLHTSAELTKHASAKAADVRSLGLGYVDPGFRILIQTEADFPVELAQLRRCGATYLPPTGSEPDVAGVRDWQTANSELTSNLIRKVSDLRGCCIDTEDEIVADFTSRFLHCENILDHFRVNHPAIYEQMVGSIHQRERLLALETATTNLAAAQLVGDQTEQLRGRLADSVPSLGSEDLDNLAWGCVGGWLLRCPLRFDGVPRK